MAPRRSVAYVAVKVRGREGGAEAGQLSPEAGGEAVGEEPRAEVRVCNTEWFFLQCRRWFECECRSIYANVVLYILRLPA